jgi:hypothetical protein
VKRFTVVKMFEDAEKNYFVALFAKGKQKRANGSLFSPQKKFDRSVLRKINHFQYKNK